LHRCEQWGIWNVYNRVPVYLKAGDGTASWNYTTATVRPSNGSTANNLTIFSGLAEDAYDLSFIQSVNNASTSSAALVNGIGYNSTSANTGKTGYLTGIGGLATGDDMVARYLAPPALGINIITSTEKGTSAGTVTWLGTEASMLLSAVWRG